MTVKTADVKNELAFDADAVGLTPADFDSLISDGLDAATDRVEEWIDASLTTETATEDISRPEHVAVYDLPLPERPVQSVASVDVDTDRVGGATVSPEDYRVEATHIELEPAADREEFPTERRSVTVEYTHGYAVTPRPVEKAIIRLVRHRLQTVESDGISSESIGGDSVTYSPPRQLVEEIKEDLSEYKAPSYYGGASLV